MAATRKQSKGLKCFTRKSKAKKTYRTCKNSKGQLRKNSARKPKSGKRGSKKQSGGFVRGGSVQGFVQYI